MFNKSHYCLLMLIFAFVGLLFSFTGPVQASIIDASIYYGHDSVFGSSATNPASIQGYTDLHDRWNSQGANTVITNAFNPVGQDIFLLSNPTSNLSASEITALQTFLGAGGFLILTHDGTIGSLNQATTDLGSSLSFGATRVANGAIAQVVDDTSPFMVGLTNGDLLNTIHPGQISGGNSLVDYPIGTSIISVESLLGGTILGVADFDILNNVATDWFGPGIGQNNVLQFQDNILGAATPIPEPATMLLLGTGLVGVAGVVRRRKKNQTT